jgi:hypothetical protein
MAPNYQSILLIIGELPKRDRRDERLGQRLADRICPADGTRLNQALLTSRKSAVLSTLGAPLISPQVRR